MKLVVLILFCLLIDNTYSQEHILYNYLPKCSIDKEILRKLSTDGSEWVESLSDAFSKLPEHGEEFCKNYTKELNIKASWVAEDLKPCLLSRHQFFIDFFKSSFKEFTHFWCHNDREYMKRLFSESNSCINSIRNDSRGPPLISCLLTIFRPSSDYRSKKELCDDIPVVEECFETLLNKKCHNSSSSYRQLNEIFFQYIKKPCSGCVIFQINILLLIVSATVSYVFGKN